MTIMRVTLAGTDLDPEQKGALARRLIDAFASVEVGQSTPPVRAGFVVQIEQVSIDDVWMGDARMADAGSSGRAAMIDTRVMAGPWDDAMKAELFERLEAIVREAAAMPKEGAGAEFWMTIVEVPEGAWGYGGRTVSIASLAPVFSEDRQVRIRHYLGSDDD